MKRRFTPTILLFGIVMLLLFACTEAPEADSQAAIAAATVQPAATAAPTRTPRPTATSEPTPTPIPPAIEAGYQIVGADGVLVIDSVTAPSPAWLVAYPDRQMELAAEEALGFVAVPAGESDGIGLSIDPDWGERTIQLGLHVGREGDDFSPTMENLLLLKSLEIDTRKTIPAIEVSDQAVGEDGVVTIDRVYTPRGAWVAVYPAGVDDRERLLGYVPVQAGEQENLTLPIRWREAPTFLTAVLYNDAPAENVFDLELDLPVAVNGDPVAVSFNASFPPDIVARNQPVINGMLVVERVISEGAGWLVVYEDGDGDGQPGFIIGSVAVENGLNENRPVEVDRSAVTGQLLLTLHDDTGEPGEFDFPANDPPRRYRDQAFFYSMQTDTGGFIETADQLVDNGEIKIPFVVAENDFWVVIHPDENGRPGDEILGLRWLAAGYYHDVVVSLDENPAPGEVHAMVYQDNGQREIFERNQTDFPIQALGRQLTAPMRLLPVTADR